MSNTGENIYERRDWRWEGRYICGRKPDGRARYISVYGRSRTEVQTKIQKQLQTSASNSEPPGIGQSDLTVNQLFELFLKRATVKRSTYARYKTVIDLHILPRLGKRRVCTLTAKELSAYDKLDKAGKNSLKTEYKRLTACEKTLKKNEKAVQKVQTLLAKLPAAEDVMTKLSLTDKKNVTAAEKAYNPLTEDQRTFFTEDEHAKMQANSERMQTLIEGETLIKAAEKAIKSLPADTKIKATDSKKLETAQEAYDKVKNSEDGLTIDPKLAEKFETSRTAYYAYQQQAEDFRSEYLDALPENANAVTAEYETAIPAAQTAYKALSKNVQSFIEKAEVSHLKACEKTLKKNQSAAGKVDKLIAKLPADVSAEFTAKDEKAINAAWKAYSKLTSEQKTFLEDEQHLLDCYNKAYPEG